MEQYKDWQEGDNNLHAKCPIHNIIVSPMINQNPTNYEMNRIIPSNYIQQGPHIYPSQRQIIQTTNQNLSNNYYNYPQYSYQNNQQYNFNKINNNNNYNQREYNHPSKYKNKISNPNNTDTFTKYESSDGVLRGYTNNYSFYVSGSSKIKPKIDIKNEPNQYNNSNINYINTNQNQYEYQNSNLSQNNIGQYQNIINSNNNGQIMNQNDNSSYIIRVIDNEPNIYNSQNQQYENNYYNNNVYYINENENGIIEQRNFQQPKIQRRIVNTIPSQEPSDSRREYYIIEPKDNLRNRNQNSYRNNNIQQRPIPTFQKINNTGFKKYYSNVINERHENTNQINDHFNSYQPIKRNNTPNIQRPNTTNYQNYSGLRMYRQQKRIIDPNYSQNNPTSLSYNQIYPYKTYTEQNDGLFVRNETESPTYKSPYVGYSPNINDNRYVYPSYNRQREYTSRTELQNQRGFEYEYENDEDDDIYEVPEQYNKNNNIINRAYYEERRPNNISERPFTRISNYSQTQRRGRKYGVYTQTLAMNKNYSNNNEYEYEIDMPGNRSYNNIKENYSQPKIMRPINEVQRLLKQKREYSAFERSLRNIRNNEEEIELENRERNNRMRIRTGGNNKQRIHSLNNSIGRNKRYRTFTEQQDYRNQDQGYILQDIDDSNIEDYDMYQNQINKNKNIKKYNNLRIVQNVQNGKIENRRKPYPQYNQEENDYYEEEQIESNLNRNNVKNRNINRNNFNPEEEIEDDDDNNGEEQMYDSSQLIKAKEGNFGIVQNNFNEMEIKDNYKKNRRGKIIESQRNINDQLQENEGEMEEQGNIEEDEIYRNRDTPQDRDEDMQNNGKNMKNIETEINEKYYDNQGNYLGEKKIITTKQVPINNKREEYIPQQDEGEYFEEQEEQEENENEYIPYQSSHKKFKKRGENMIGREIEKTNLNMNENNYKESKYHSYFGNSNNNVYYEIKGVSGEIQEESKNDEEIGNKNDKHPMTLTKNVTFGIQSENLCVPAEDNEKENKENEQKHNNNDEKEADEQQFEENAEMDEEDEEQNNINRDNNDKHNNLQIEKNISENIYENKNENTNGKENENGNMNEDTNENKNIEYKSNKYKYNNLEEENKSNNIDENNINNIDENNFNNIKENNENNFEENNYNNNEENYYNNEDEIYDNQIEENINKENIHEDMHMNENNDYGNDYNVEYEDENNEEEQMIEENEGEEIENQNVQKDEGEEGDIVDIEGDNNYYHQEYEENENFEGEEGEGEETSKYNYKEEGTNKVEIDENGEEN